jgi:hypothetical protein
MEQYKVIETNNVNGIVREIKNLNIYQAENTYFKILNTNPVRRGYNNVRIIKIKSNENNKSNRKSSKRQNKN